MCPLLSAETSAILLGLLALAVMLFAWSYLVTQFFKWLNARDHRRPVQQDPPGFSRDPQPKSEPFKVYKK